MTIASWGGPGLFAFAVLPLPFDLAGVWAGATRYSLPRFMTFVLAGTVVKMTAIAFAGSQVAGWF